MKFSAAVILATLTFGCMDASQPTIPTSNAAVPNPFIIVGETGPATISAERAGIWSGGRSRKSCRNFLRNCPFSMLDR